ncbi:serine/threonine protein kinase [Tumebacillus sp. BK434]|uniref:serine/threonine protein kinase n=1 Tax=Tumebacillus sp. BK434 TaxID=2512169 RepID=UPI00104BA7F4|nr:protein kinase [Tumebacillus sp. BK434]TCP57593.1 serine/threonine protein kinase [Tumebacillus sp. BK434]
MRRLKAWWQGVYARLVDRPYAAGTVIHGRYTIEAVLGMGSYGITYLCRDAEANRRCVLKQVRPSKLGSNKGQPLYDYEIKVLQALDHPQIPKLLDRFTHERQLFFAMEHVSGRNLEDLIFDEGRTMCEPEALQVILELLDIVDYLHRKRLVHRDIRIPNVILQNGRLHLIDFGLARYLGDPATYIEEDLGAYVWEKQVKREVAFKSDYWGLGHFLLFLLYTTFTASEQADEQATWEEELDLHPATQRLIRRLIQIDPPYENSAELRSDLQAARSLSSKVHNSDSKIRYNKTI